jgi:CheY-like chemotaxis protein
MEPLASDGPPGTPGGQGQGAGPALRVLVVEDDLEAAEALGLLLRRWGHLARVTLDGPTALEAAAREGPPDVALLDLRLPGGLDGYEVARRLGWLPGTKQPLLIALTGLAGEEDRRRSEAAGIHLHLAKPVNGPQLKRVLRQFAAVLGN